VTEYAEDRRVPKLSEGVLVRSEDFGCLVFNPKTDTVIQTNSVGAEIFRSSDGRHTISEISKLIADKFEVEDKVARKDTEVFLLKLVELDLIKYV